MVTTPVYSLQILGNNNIEISQDELRSLLGEIEAELHRSQVYRRALAIVQKLLGESADQAKNLLKAVGREAISLTFRQFAQQYQKVEKVTETKQQLETANESLDLQQNSSSELPQSLKKVKTYTSSLKTNNSEDNLASQSQVAANTANNSGTTTQENPTANTPLRWFKNKKTSQPELGKQTAAKQRIESLRQIGQQLRQARESKGICVHQLTLYTCVPMHHIEAVENGNWDLLPEDVFVRGFIRLMGNALGLNGTALAASLPAQEAPPPVVPSWCQSQNDSTRVGLEIHPMHLYIGYTALVAGAVGGLSLLSQQQANVNTMINHSAVTPPSSSMSESYKQKEPTTKPGIKFSNGGITVGSDISPPEAL